MRYKTIIGCILAGALSMTGINCFGAESGAQADAMEYAVLEEAADEECSPQAANITVEMPYVEIECIFGGRTVMFLSETYDAKIYYTTEDRTTITTNDICVENGETVVFNEFDGYICARAYYKGQWSDLMRYRFTIPVVDTPTAERLDSNRFQVSSTTEDAYLYYTTDGTTPTLQNYKGIVHCSGTISASTGSVVKVVGMRSGFTDSDLITIYF